MTQSPNVSLPKTFARQLAAAGLKSTDGGAGGTAESFR
jgi:hypothetical protein